MLHKLTVAFDPENPPEARLVSGVKRILQAFAGAVCIQFVTRIT